MFITFLLLFINYILYLWVIRGQRLTFTEKSILAIPFLVLIFIIMVCLIIVKDVMFMRYKRIKQRTIDKIY